MTIPEVKELKNERGSLLVGSVIILFFMVTFGLSFLKMGQYEADLANRRLRDLQAFWKGEEGLSLAAALLRDSTNVNGLETQTAPSSDRLTARVTVSLNAGSKYLARSSVFNENRAADTLVVLSMLLEPSTSGGFFLMEDHAGPSFYDTGDTIRGPVHTNDCLRVKGVPVFYSDVFESGCSDDQGGFHWDPLDPQTPPKIVSDHPPVWNAVKYDFSKLADKIRGAEKVDVGPDQKALVELKGKTLWLSYRSKSDPPQETPPTPQLLEPNTGLYFTGDVEIHGTLNGRLTVGAKGDITISDDLIYQPNTNSVLGLISENNVKVNQQQQTHEVGKGITIQASIVAVKGSFEVVNYQRYGNNSMGTMHFLGSIAQYQRGTIGSVKLKGNVHKGYFKDWVYDERLRDEPPPYYSPLTPIGSNQMTLTTVAWSRTL